MIKTSRKPRSDKGVKRGPYKKRTMKLVENYKSNNLSEEKKRKMRSNKGKKRGPYKPRVQKKQLKLVEDYESETEKRERKQRSNKGKKRGPYKKRTKKLKVPDIVVEDYNEREKEKEWHEVEDVLLQNFRKKKRIDVVLNKKNNRPLGKTRSGRAFRNKN